MSRKQNIPPATPMPPDEFDLSNVEPDPDITPESMMNDQTYKVLDGRDLVGTGILGEGIEERLGQASPPTGKETTATTDVSASSEASVLPPAPNAPLDTPVMAFDQGRSGWLSPPPAETPPAAFDQGPEGWKGDAIEETVAPTAMFDPKCLSQNSHVPNCECTGVARKPIAA